MIASLKQNRALLTGSTYFFANTLAVSTLGFLFWWLAAHLYPTRDVGITVVLVSTAQLITTLTQGGLSFSLIRFLPVSGTKKLELINVSLTYVGGLTLALTLVVILTGPRVSPTLALLAESWLFAAAFLLFVVALALFQLTYPILAALRAGRLLAQTNLLTGLGRVGLVILLARSPGPAALGLAFALPTLIAVVVVLGVVLPGLIRDYTPRLELKPRRWGHVLKYSAASYAGNLWHDLPYQLLPQVIANQVGPAGAAYFFIVWNFFSLLTTLGNSISLALFVEGSHASEPIGRLAAKTGASVVITTAVLTGLTMIFARPLLLIFGPDYAAHGAVLLQVAAIAAIPATIVYAKVAALRVKMRLGPVVTAFAIIAGISLAPALTHSFHNLITAGLVWALAQAAAAAYLIIWDQKGERHARP